MSSDRQQCSDDWEEDMITRRPRVVFEQKFESWESLSDWDRDMTEALDQDYNPAMKGIPGEFDGTFHVVITYTPGVEDEKQIRQSRKSS